MDNFPTKSGRNGKVLRSYHCKKCRSEYYSFYRKKNIETIRPREKNAVAEKRYYIQSLKTKCLCCDENFGPCLEFHHKDSSKKEFELSKGIKKSMEDIDREIAKCIVLCSNCHKKYHAGVPDIVDKVNNVFD